MQENDIEIGISFIAIASVLREVRKNWKKTKGFVLFQDR